MLFCHLHSDHMVKVIGPDGIASVSAFVAREQKLPFVSWILTNHQGAKRLRSLGDFLNEMLRRLIRDGVSRVEPETVDVKFFHPIDADSRQNVAGQVLPRAYPG